MFSRRRHRVDVRDVSRIEPSPRSRTGYSAYQLRGALASIPMRLSRGRRFAAIVPLMVALASWFVVPSFASSYVNPDARAVGISGGSGRCVWDGAKYLCPLSNYKAYGYFHLAEHGGGTAVNGYCLDLDKAHVTGDILDESGDTRDGVAWILSNFYPAPGYAEVDPWRLNSDEDEAAAVQIAIWGWTNDAFGSHPPKGTWPSSGRKGEPGSITVVQRAKDIYETSKNAGGPWANAEGQPTMKLSVSDAHPAPGATITVTATVKTATGGEFDGPAHNGPGTPHIHFTATGGTLGAADDNIGSHGHASVTFKAHGGPFSIKGESVDLVTRKGVQLVPRNGADQRIGISRWEHRSVQDSVGGTPTTPPSTPPSTPTPVVTPTPTPVVTPTPTPVVTPTPTPIVTPTVTTQVSNQSALVGDKIHDTVVVSDSSNDVATATVNLFGPFAAPPTAASCTGTPAWHGTVDVHGDASYVTADFTIAQAGYYTYQETLPATSGHAAVTTECAVSAETTLASPVNTPNVTTQVSEQSGNVGDKIHDTVVVSGSNNYQGSVSVSLWGPFDSAPTAESCSGTPAWTGAVTVKGDGSYVTADFTVAQAGFYTYQETLPADHGHNAVTTVCGITTETTHITQPVSGGVQPITVGQVQGVETPVTGVGTGVLRSSIIGICLMISGLIVVTGYRRSPHAATPTPRRRGH
jgi:hypothetical protein